ncbi:MAG: hypothetical protein GX575_02290 [Candidatus Anammoximicrobium sp.]|nr:hypothetical protein [Candidatus Anammoximicrobium sp.]
MSPRHGRTGGEGEVGGRGPHFSDGYDKSYYHQYAGQMAVDPTGPAGAFIRVIRGGDWDHEGVRCRRASRLKTLAGNKTSFLGFRLALTQ